MSISQSQYTERQNHLDSLLLFGETLLLKMDFLAFFKANPHWHMQPRVPAGQPDGGQWLGEGIHPANWRVRVAAAVWVLAKTLRKMQQTLAKSLVFDPLPLPFPVPPLLEAGDYLRWEPSLRRPYMPYLEFDNFAEFGVVFGPAGAGKNWHHIVEQRMDSPRPGGGLVFPSRSIQNTDNIVLVTVVEHACLNRRYSSFGKLPDGTYGLLRPYLNNKPWTEHYSVGLRELRECRRVRTRRRR